MKIFKGLYEQYGYRIMEVILVCLFFMIGLVIYNIERQHKVNKEMIKNQREVLEILKK